MSQNHNDEIETTEPINTNNTSSTRRLSPGHINLKPTVVFDHIKTKVKQKRSSNNLQADIPTNRVRKRSVEPSHDGKTKKSLAITYSQPTAVSPKSSDESCENQPSPVQDENGLDASDSPEKEDEINESDNDTNTQLKSSKSKSKLNRMSKMLTEQNQSMNRKTRRTLQPPSKLDLCKKKKNNELSQGDSLSMQITTPIRDEDFQKIFKDTIPSTEQLIIAYPCAWRKDMFMHGRLFLTINHICFYTCFLKWEESLCIAYKDIVSVTREKCGKLIPNAIQLKTKNREQYLFASYNQRERIFIGIFRLWQNALLENPLDYQQLKGFIFADQMNIHESSGDSDESDGFEDNSLLINSASIRGLFDEKRPTITEPETPTYLSSCPCESHLAKIYAERTFPIAVDQLFDLAFGDNPFTRAYHESQKLIDYIMSPWTKNNETGKRERQVTYKTVTQSILGTNTITCNEKQTIELEKPHSIYILTSEVFNEGMKYTDAFYVTTKFCMFQRDAKLTFLRVTAEVRYVKTVNAIARSFIEKNCHSNIESGVDNLVRRLDNFQTTKTPSKSDNKSKRQSCKKRTEDSPSFEEKQDKQLPIIHNEILVQQRTLTGKGLVFDLILFIGIAILILHIYLCYKLYKFDGILSNSNIVCHKVHNKHNS